MVSEHELYVMQQSRFLFLFHGHFGTFAIVLDLNLSLSPSRSLALFLSPLFYLFLNDTSAASICCLCLVWDHNSGWRERLYRGLKRAIARTDITSVKKQPYVDLMTLIIMISDLGLRAELALGHVERRGAIF